MAEYRYRAVREVLGAAAIGEVTARYGTSRQILHSWRRRFEQESMPGLLDRSRHPRNSPTRLPAEVEAEICELRRQHPRWGARRITHELAHRELTSAPWRATVHRVLSRNGLVSPQEQQHPQVPPVARSTHARRDSSPS
ncbi:MULTISPECIES: helix-turn-helix domain-containing protein [unclassified Streptomyces]|uniref:Helix-turn-helix domain-containing protein n=1 Tax=Streptomyces sp. NBC_00119 TaxID=2975659 RepID=A0AAU1ULJ5_9ACTN|nr:MULTISPECIES: helix-turn-helix domain-containing protein [unclassified Streptomyces]MCX4649544.1 helix-turn-helix domain-containing protein [Streptomyces sp. NBC_01446]MCX5321258.1 helix-turn-helix domain-containing protein [Streptomyces sp. NBC_00120]